MELSDGRVGAILGPWVAGVLQERYSGPTAMLLAITVGALIAAAAIARARDEPAHPFGKGRRGERRRLKRTLSNSSCAVNRAKTLAQNTDLRLSQTGCRQSGSNPRTQSPVGVNFRVARHPPTMAVLKHPNIAKIRGLENSDTTRALVMELIEGPTIG